MNIALIELFARSGIIIEGNTKPYWNRCVCKKCYEQKETKAKDLAFNMSTGQYICHKCSWSGNVMYQKKKEYSRPNYKEYKPSDLVKEFLFQRGISESTFKKLIEQKLVAYTDKPDIFAFQYWRDDEFINYKLRDTGENKIFAQQRDGEKILYNINSCKGKDIAIIVEGEMSAIACIEAGLDEKYAIVSLENGASKEGSVEGKLAGFRNCYLQTAHIKRWIVALDNDQAGVYTASELIKHIGEHKCNVIKYPDGCKDPDDVINRKKRPQYTAFENNTILREMFENSVEFPVRGIITLNETIKELLMSYKKHGRPPAVKLPMFGGAFHFKRGDYTIVSGYVNCGKALCISTPIPTIDGWKKMEDIDIGDVVFDEHGEQCKVTGVSDIQQNRSCYELTFSDGSTVICDEDHLWNTYSVAARGSESRQKNKKNRSKHNDQRHKCIKPQTLTTKDVIKTFFTSRMRPNHSINLCGQIKTKEIDLEIKPYMLGYWLADGDTMGGRITTAEVEVIEKIRSLGYVVSANKAKYRYGVLGLTTKLNKECLIGSKRIPLRYLRASIEQRIELLKGLMDGDGCISKSGMCEFCVTKEELANDVYELMTSLGIKATINKSEARLYGRFISYRYRLIFKPRFNVFTISKNIKRHKDGSKCNYRYIKSFKKVDSVPVKCIAVDSPSKTYLCTKSFIPTHNTTFATNMAYLTSMEYLWKWAIFAGEQHPQDRYFEDLAQMILKKPIEDKDMSGKPIEGCATPDEYEAALEFISNHFYLVYPEKGQKPTLEWMMEKVMYLKEKHGINGVIIDTFNKLKHDFKNNRDDVYLDDWHDLAISHAAHFDAFILLMHPAKPAKLKSGAIPMMSIYDIAGGAMTPNKADNVIIVHRESRFGEEQIPNNITTIYFGKIRDQKTVGKIGQFKVEYFPEKNNYKYGNAGYWYNKTLAMVTGGIIQSVVDEDYLDTDEIPF